MPGRFESVDEGQPFLVVVDYAHTDDALRNVIAVARELHPKRVITLFGCGGDRDRSKRPLMGMAAGRGQRFCGVDVGQSALGRSDGDHERRAGGIAALRHPTFGGTGPGKAIRAALDAAKPGDIVILAGKGHEPYQVLKDRVIHFDDREVARAALRGRVLGDVSGW